jgi:putative phosphoesterase
VTIGLISDTHGFLDPKVPRLFAGVTHILHAGDIGGWQIVPELEQIAPVTAVLGNNDADLFGRETEVIELGGLKFLVHHIVSPDHPGSALRERLERFQPDVVIFGHTHQAFSERRGARWFINPGYAGKPRFNLPRSVAVLELGTGEPALRFMDL